VAPQRAGHIVENFGVQLLTAKPGAAVAADDLVEKRRREVLRVLDCAAAGDGDLGVGEQFADKPGRARRRGNDSARVGAEPKAPSISMSQACG
jgi:hypothetical protein